MQHRVQHALGPREGVVCQGVDPLYDLISIGVAFLEDQQDELCRCGGDQFLVDHGAMIPRSARYVNLPCRSPCLLPDWMADAPTIGLHIRSMAILTAMAPWGFQS